MNTPSVPTLAPAPLDVDHSITNTDKTTYRPDNAAWSKIFFAAQERFQRGDGY
jgi:hypothetical protein